MKNHSVQYRIVRCQGCASKVGEPSSGHWSKRDLPAPCNMKWRKSPRGLHLNVKTQLHSTTSKIQCRIPYANNEQERNTTPSISKEAAYNHKKATDTPKHTTTRGPAYQKDKIQPHPSEHRHYSPPPGSLHNPLNQP